MQKNKCFSDIASMTPVRQKKIFLFNEKHYKEILLLVVKLHND